MVKDYWKKEEALYKVASKMSTNQTGFQGEFLFVFRGDGWDIPLTLLNDPPNFGLYLNVPKMDLGEAIVAKDKSIVLVPIKESKTPPALPIKEPEVKLERGVKRKFVDPPTKDFKPLFHDMNFHLGNTRSRGQRVPSIYTRLMAKLKPSTLRGPVEGPFVLDTKRLTRPYSSQGHSRMIGGKLKRRLLIISRLENSLSEANRNLKAAGTKVELSKKKVAELEGKIKARTQTLELVRKERNELHDKVEGYIKESKMKKEAIAKIWEKSPISLEFADQKLIEGYNSAQAPDLDFALVRAKFEEYERAAIAKVVAEMKAVEEAAKAIGEVDPAAADTSTLKAAKVEKVVDAARRRCIMR
uniref:Fgenesh protein 32 n=1 Tax=Beta vulgaris TaxID=161934 RepID=Q20CE3_BETVU|nr:Fgenesh protein 32 [Beta vulgaris]